MAKLSKSLTGQGGADSPNRRLYRADKDNGIQVVERMNKRMDLEEKKARLSRIARDLQNKETLG